MKIEFLKFSGAKNIFLIADKVTKETDEFFKKKPNSRIQFVKKVCDENLGFHADGVVFLEQKSDSEYIWEFYNSDGSSAEMCGNAVRCAHRYIQTKYEPRSDTISITTISGQVSSTYQAGCFHVQMPTPKEKSEIYLASEFFNHASFFSEFECVSNGKALFVDTGVPHLVIAVHDWPAALLLTPVWMFLRNHHYFKKGTNVTLVQSHQDASALAISFERGVDGFTQACGTGAVAAAIYVGQLEKIKKINILMPGGKLIVDLNNSAPILIGQVDEMGKYSVNLNLEAEE